MAHEISHLRNDDIRVMSLAALSGRVTGAFSLFGMLLLLFSLPLMLVSQVHVNWLALALLIFAPQLSALAQLGLSRVREYRADLSAVETDRRSAGTRLGIVENRPCRAPAVAEVAAERDHP